MVHCDSQSAMHLVKNQMFHERSKHIDVKMHYVRDIVNSGIVIVKKISMDHNPIDMIPIPISSRKFNHCLELVRLKEEP